MFLSGLLKVEFWEPLGNGVWGLPKAAEIRVPELAPLCSVRGWTWSSCVPVALLWMT